MLPYAAYLFIIENLSAKTIRTYIAALQYFLFSNDYIKTSVWTPRLNQSLKAYVLQESRERPLSQRHKLPITLSMIFWGYHNVIKSPSHPFWPNQSISMYAHVPFVHSALLASLCMGFMFLFRKSEYLTGPDRSPKIANSQIHTLIAADTNFWYGDLAYPASSPSFPSTLPTMLSIYLPLSKGDPLGKGATRFFPADPNNPSCLVSIIFAYVRQANLSKSDCLFAGPRFVVTSTMVDFMIKYIAAGSGLNSQRFSPHSLRVGGLVSLFAANVPDHLKQLAGRWSDPKSFITYARATIQQFTQISTSLNDHSLVTADHIHKFYS